MVSTKITAKDRLIVALDVSTLDEAKKLIDELRDDVGMFKVGLEIFTSCGTELFDLIATERLKVFFDSKFMDIPNTVAGASRALGRRGMAMFNVHAMGGGEMMKAAARAAREGAAEAGVQAPLSLAVTILTSISDATLRELSIENNIARLVPHLALVARQSGIDGVVASAQEIESIRKACGQDFLIVTPGIRPSWSAADDQARIVTPADAVKRGVDYIVVGRPITRAQDRRDAARRIVNEMEGA